jgi:hypothetical protein
MNEGDVFLELGGSSWFYNNEYFNPYYKGYTLIGAEFQPVLSYKSSQKLKYSAGIDLHRFYGDDLKTRALPFFNICYRPTEKLSLLLGSYNGGENHGVNEILFSFENHLTDLVENGVLINYNGKIINSETWLNWESFIFPGDTVQEKFTAGSSEKLNIVNTGRLLVSIPVSLLAHHSGGQINVTDRHVETLLNTGEGLLLKYKPHESKSFFISGAVNLFQSMGDFNPSPGQAYYLSAGAGIKNIEFYGGYYNARDFITFSGNPIYFSNELTSDPLHPVRRGGNLEMLNFKAGLRKKTGENSFLYLRFEGYYFMGEGKLDYSYSLHFQVMDFLRLFNVR